MRRRTIDWRRVAGLLGAKDPEAIVTCRYCRAQGSVPYVAEHLLATHPESKTGKMLTKIVLEQGPRTA